MSKTRDTGYLANAVKVDQNGNLTFVSGSTTLLSVSSSGAMTTTGVISGSNATNALLLDGTGSLAFATTASVATSSGSVSSRLTQIERVYATTGSNSFRADQSITGSLTVTSNLIAQTLVVSTISSSVEYSSGSNIFGNSTANTQTMTGSLNVTGSATVVGNLTLSSGGDRIISVNDTGGNLFQIQAASNALYYSARTTGGSLVFRSNGTNDSKLTIGSDGNATFSGSVTANGGIVASVAANDTVRETNAAAWIGSLAAQDGLMIQNLASSPYGTALQVGGYGSNYAANYPMILQPRGGNVGIGTASPGRTLDISKTGGADFGITAVTSGNASATFKGYASGTNVDAATSRASTIDLINLDTTNGNTNAVIFNNSNQLASSYIAGVNVNHTSRTGDLVIGTANGSAPTERMRITSGGIACFACQVCTPNMIVNTTSDGYNMMCLVATGGDAGIYLRGGASNTGGWTIQAQNSCNFVIVDRTAGAYPVRMTIASGGVTCFSSTVCAPTVIGGAVSAGGQPPRSGAALFAYGGGASTVLTNQSQIFHMFGKNITSSNNAPLTPLFTVCDMGGNTGIFAKISIIGTSATGANMWEDAGYAWFIYTSYTYRCSGYCLFNVVQPANGHTIGTLCWGGTATTSPYLQYCQANNNYITEGIDVRVVVRDSANIWFCTNNISVG